MHFLQVNVKFYDAVNMIHDDKFILILSVLEIIKLNKSDTER